MKCAVTGSFDPVTYGHISLVESALNHFDIVYVLVLVNEQKEYTFSLEQRLKLLKMAFKNYARVVIKSYDGMGYDFCHENEVDYLVRGIRDKADYEYEKQLAKANLEMGNMPTLILPSNCAEVSSSKLKKVLEGRGRFLTYVPKEIGNAAKKMLKEKKETKEKNDGECGDLYQGDGE